METKPGHIKLIQSALRFHGYPVNSDGQWGPKSQAAYDALTSVPSQIKQGAGFSIPKPGKISIPSPSEKNSFYGTPNKNYKHLKIIKLPYQMSLSWEQETTVTKISCHEKIASAMQDALAALYDFYKDDGIVQNGLHLYGGCYNHRRIRGGRSWSDHAYGVAIDLNPDQNGLRTPWSAGKVGQPGYGTMPLKAVEIFEKFGFCNIAKKIGRDAMHFSAVKYY